MLGSSKKTRGRDDTKFEVVEDMEEAFKGADVCYAKSWGPIVVTEEPKAVQVMCDEHKDWICDERRMGLSKKKSIYMHCMPIDRGYEATDAVVDSAFCHL